jgi:hypothetical protein
MDFFLILVTRDMFLIQFWIPGWGLLFVLRSGSSLVGQAASAEGW